MLINPPYMYRYISLNSVDYEKKTWVIDVPKGSQTALLTSFWSLSQQYASLLQLLPMS